MIYDFHSKASVIYHLNFNAVFKQCIVLCMMMSHVLPGHDGIRCNILEEDQPTQPVVSDGYCQEGGAKFCMQMNTNIEEVDQPTQPMVSDG